MDAPFQLDPQQQLVWDSEISAVVLGKGEQYFLIPLHFNEHAQAVTLSIARERGYAYCGVMGFKDGQCAVKCEPGMELTMCAAAFGFALLHVAPKLSAAQTDDSLDWLTKLHALKDEREEFSA